MAKRSIEDFFKQRTNYVIPDENAYVEEMTAPANYVERDRIIKNEIKNIHAQDIRTADENAALTKVKQVAPNKTVMDSGPLDVGAVLVEPKKAEVVRPIPPKVVEEAPVQEAVVEIPKTQALKEELGQKEEKSGFDTSLENPWMRALVGATPLLVGLLTGNKLEGVQTSADYFTKTEQDLWKRELDLNGKIRELAGKKEASGTRRFSPTVIDVDGESVRAVFDTHSGAYLYPNGEPIPEKYITAGYADSKNKLLFKDDVKRDYHRFSDKGFVDATTGERARSEYGKIVPMEGQGTGKFSVKQEKDIENVVKSVRQNPIYKSTSAVLTNNVTPDLITASTRINDPNWIAGQAAVFKTARAIQGAGVLTDRDVEHMGGTQQVNILLDRIIGRLRDGEPITMQDAKDLLEVHQITRIAAQRELAKYKDDLVRTNAVRYNLAPEDLDEQLSPEFSTFLGDRGVIKAPSAPRAATYKGKTYHSEDRTLTVPVIIDDTVKWTTPEDWPLVKKQYPNAKRLEANK